ncbi:MAG: sensor histidine kinase [Brevibacterium yomogidense]|uniref:sensor histidine kinase n=1 Tax=Brevibacterium sp. Mu109 TaxID=1255669 RepID=UPI000C3BA211|nr:histidine kinase [Brevibacterium sp. Mu109]SMX89361.1 Signal transduction histidine kinase [Brevibacterium sp. Mu109]
MPTGPASPPTASHRRGRALLTSLACLLLGAGCWFISAGIALDEAGTPVPQHVSAVLVLDALTGIAAAVSIGPLRRAGAWNLVLIPLSVPSSWALPAFIVAAVRIGRLRDLRTDTAAVALTLAAWLIYSLVMVQFDGSFADTLGVEAPILVVITVSLLLWGRVRSTRAALIDSLRAQADASHREQAAEVQRVLAEERVALARDMHDGLSHHLSLISMHAGALAYRDDLPPDRVREVGQTLRDSAASAHADLRQLLLSLREQPDDADPTPGLDAAPLADAASLDALIARERDRGADVCIVWERITLTELEQAPRPLTVALERILAESLVNARKHAPGAPVTVTLARDTGRRKDTAAEVVLRVTNPLTARSGGHTALSAPLPSHSGDRGVLRDQRTASAAVAASVPAAASVPLAASGPATAPTGTHLGLTGVEERARLLGGSARWAHTADDFTLEVRLPWHR